MKNLHFGREFKLGLVMIAAFSFLTACGASAPEVQPPSFGERIDNYMNDQNSLVKAVDAWETVEEYCRTEMTKLIEGRNCGMTDSGDPIIRTNVYHETKFVIDGRSVSVLTGDNSECPQGEANVMRRDDTYDHKFFDGNRDGQFTDPALNGNTGDQFIRKVCVSTQFSRK